MIGPAGQGVEVGIGDDAAVLSWAAAVGAQSVGQSGGDARLVATVDACVEGVHFTRAIASLEDVGYRSFMAAASDVAAMGARPLWAMSALTVPGGTDERELDAVVAGQREAAVVLGVPVVGGNVTRGPCLSVTTSVLGATRRPLLRSGARPGDGVWLAGVVGRAGVGLRALLDRRGLSDPLVMVCVEAWRRPSPLVGVAASLAGFATSAIDVSDGLAQDAAHVARASGVRLVIDGDRAVGCGGEALRVAAEALDLSAVEVALAGGEDYALIFTMPDEPDDVDRAKALGLTKIGDVHALGEGESPGVDVWVDGSRWGPPQGFDHLA